MLSCETTAEEHRTPPKALPKALPAYSRTGRRQALCASALNTRGNTTHEVRPTDVLLPLRLHPHIVLIARPRKQVFSSNAF